MSDAKIVGELNAANMTGNVGNCIVRYGAELNTAQRSIVPLSEIANYGAEYEKSDGISELVKITYQTAANDFIFVTDPESELLSFWFLDKNGRQSAFAGSPDGCCFVVVYNSGSQVNVFVDKFGVTAFRYNKDGTYKNTFDGTFVQAGTVLTRYNTETYTPTADYHPATKKYVDDKMSQGDISTDEVAANTAARHTHENKDLLDSITLGDINFWGDNWEYINRVSTDVDAGTLTVDTDAEGNSFNLKACAVIVYSPAVQDTTITASCGRCVGFKNSSRWGHDSQTINVIPLSSKKEEGAYTLIVAAERGGYIFYDLLLSSGNYTFIKESLKRETGSSYSPLVFAKEQEGERFAFINSKAPIECVKLTGYTNYSAPAGTIMEIWGIKK